jgi:hypothetical protein
MQTSHPGLRAHEHAAGYGCVADRTPPYAAAQLDRAPIIGYKYELLAKVRNLPFDRLRVNGLRLKLFSFSVRGELVEPQKNTFARGSI